MHQHILRLQEALLLWTVTAFIVTTPSPVQHVYTDFDKHILFTNQNDLADLRDVPVKFNISTKDINKSVTFASGVLDKMQRLETNLGWSNIHVRDGTPSHGQFIESAPEEEALHQGKAALVAAKTTMHLMNLHCDKHKLSPVDCAKHISKIQLSSSPLGSSCSNLQRTCTMDEIHSKYRSADSSCNHKRESSRGRSFTSYRRLLFPHYADGIQEPRRSINRRFALPSARLVSTTLCTNGNYEDTEMTLALMQWSQFIEHDLVHTATNKMVYSGKTIECCESDGGNLSPRYIHPFCAPISVPDDDHFYSKYGLECMPYVRSVAALKSDCSLGPIEQMNQATHYLDGSQIYGSGLKKADKLRAFVGGLLRSSYKMQKPFLPVSSSSDDHCQYNDPSVTCFLSGDSRVNAQPQLTAMHTLWHREHNRIAKELAKLNTDWNDEKLYQEARRVVIAEIQHITYNEWLPLVLGSRYNMKIQSFDDYSENVDPSVSNTFATAALRFINSMMEGQLKLYTENRKPNISLSLNEHFNKPNTVEEPGHFDALIRGLATQHSQKLDMDYAKDITSDLYKSGEYGYDVLSLDIQRGRDHGLPTYTAIRKLCNLSPVQKFEDLRDVMIEKRIELLKKVYRSPQDIDILVGGMSENPDGDSLLGPTFSCLIAEQLARTKKGDRYFYTNDDQPFPFLPQQIESIETVTLARIFCDNGDDIKTMQSRVFEKIGERNGLVNCKDDKIPKLNVRLWSSGSH